MNDDRLAVRVGAVVLALLAAAVAAVLLLEGRHVRPGIRVAVELERTGRLQVGAPLRFSGLTVGSVDAVRLVTGDAEEPVHAVLEVWIDRRHAWLARESTDFFVNQDSPLGEAHLALAERPGVAAGRPLVDGARVRGVTPPRLDRLLGQSYRNLEAATALLREGLPELESLGAALADLRVSFDAFEEPELTRGSVSRLWRELRAWRGADLRGLGSSVADARRVTARATVELDSLGARVRRLAAALRPLADAQTDPRVSRLLAALDRAGAIVERAELGLAIARGLIDRVRRGQGTLGALLSDVELADEIKEASKELKQQPWRTLARPSR